MALNSFVTPDGGEIGRAQAVQAEAAGIAPCVEMNPILLKPEGETRSQVIVLGAASAGSFTFSEYHQRKPELDSDHRRLLCEAARAYDIVVIEGAGSPAEINLAVAGYREHARRRGRRCAGHSGRRHRSRRGLRAVRRHDRSAGRRPSARASPRFLINKFRGDPTLLKPGLDYLAKRFGIPVLGVVPYVPRLRIADEDSVALEDRRNGARRSSSVRQIEIAIVRLPHISNYDDFLALEHEAGVIVRFVESPAKSRAPTSS